MVKLLTIYKNKLMKGVDIMNDLAGFEGLIYSRDELKGELQEKREEQREFMDTIREFNSIVTEYEKRVLKKIPIFKTFKELSGEELEVFYSAGYEVTPFRNSEIEGYTIYSIQLKEEDYEELYEVEDLSAVIDELHKYLKWHDIKPLAKDWALYMYSGEDVYRLSFITLLHEILKDKPELKELLKLK